MAEWREYTEVLDVTLEELSKMVAVQNSLIVAATRKQTATELKEILDRIGVGAIAVKLLGKTKFGRFTVAAAGVAWAFVETVNYWAVNDYSLQRLLESGKKGLEKNLLWFSSNASTFQRIQFEAAFLEYTFTTSSGRETIRYLQIADPPHRMQYKNGKWITED